MELLYILPIFIVGLTLVWLPSYLTLRHKYKYYKPTYEAIKNKEYLFYNESESFITFKPKDRMNQPTWMIDDSEILYFKEKGDIKLIKEYIHNSAPFFDPYTIYWRRKIEKEILYHSRSIDQIREDKLKQLLK